MSSFIPEAFSSPSTRPHVKRIVAGMAIIYTTGTLVFMGTRINSRGYFLYFVRAILLTSL